MSHNAPTAIATPEPDEEGAMPRPDRGFKQIGLRVPATLLKEAEEVAKLLSRADIGYTATKADAFRVAIERGFAAIRAEVKAQRGKK